MTDRMPSASATRRLQLVALAALTVLATFNARLARAAESLPPDEFDAPRPIVGRPSDVAPRGDQADRILLVSTRAVGTQCDAAAMREGLRCEARGADGRWTPISWPAVVAEFAAPMPTVVYIHGNRVDAGVDKAHGMAVHQWLASRRTAGAPMRYVIWSWPSSQVRGRIKDYEVKAARCRPCGWQLAWAIDQLPAEAPLAIIGYSYGARVTTGALHVLGGGSLDGLRLGERVHADRAPVRVALVAAAVDAAWLRPGGYHARALSQMESLLLVNNQLDPAMRFYPISPVGRHNAALGYAGLGGRESLGEYGSRVRSLDMTDAVGRHHDLGAYFEAQSMLGAALVKAIEPANGNPAVDRQLVDRTVSTQR